MEHEVNGLDYRYVYGNERLSVNVSPITNGSGHIVESGAVGQQIRLYYHQDLRGTVDYLTSPVSQKVESWTHYNEWGEITHNAVLKCGQRELDLVKNYTGHDFDAVLNMYYAKARMYDAENRRFVALDPIMDGSVYDISERVTDPMMFVKYLYVKDNPLVYIDPLGLAPQKVKKDGVYFREKNGINGSVICSLKRGTIVNSTPDNQYPYYVDGHYWTKVEYQGRTGWIASEYLDNNATTAAKSGVQYIVDASALNVRQWPSAHAKKIDTLKTNARVTTLGAECYSEGYTWAKVKINATGKQGWVAKVYLKEPVNSSGYVSVADLTQETYAPPAPMSIGDLQKEYYETIRPNAGYQEPLTCESEDKSYLEQSWNQIVYGNYTDDVTLLGTGGQVALGFFGLDLPLDIRDITYDLTHFELSWDHLGQTAIDAIAFLPLVGALKYSDEAGTLLKHADEASDILKHADEAGDVLKHGDDIGDGYKAAGKIDALSDFARRGLDPDLMAELAESGYKYSADDVIKIMKSSDDQLVWLEKGSKSAGLEHIISRHGSDFAKYGIPESEIPDLLESAVKTGKNAGKTANGATKFEVFFNGKQRKLLITISDNGFIVQANPGGW